MKKILLILCGFLLACETTPKNPEAWIESEINACVPTAIIFKQSLRKYDVWAEVFRYTYYNEDKRRYGGHAMVAYLYPPGKNQLWTYDSMGSYRTHAFTNDVNAIARYAHAIRGWGEIKPGSAQWVK